MTLEDVQKAAAELPAPDRKRLIGFLLEFNRTPEQRAERGARALRDAGKILDDPNREWVELEDAKQRVEKLAAERGNA
jgi:hypothetical protein